MSKPGEEEEVNKQEIILGAQEPKGVILSAQSNLSVFFDWASAFIATSALIVFLGLISLYFYKDIFPAKPVMSDTKATVTVVVSDTIKSGKKLSVLLDSILKQNAALKDSVQLFSSSIKDYNKSTENYSDRLKIILSIIGLIFAITGFFGLKSLNDIREHSIKSSEFNSKEIAQKVAEHTSKFIAEKTAYEVSARVAKNEATDIARKIAKSTADDVANDVVKEIFKEKFLNIYQADNKEFQKAIRSEIDQIHEAYDRNVADLEARVSKIEAKKQQNEEVQGEEDTTHDESKIESEDDKDGNIFEEKDKLD